MEILVTLDGKKKVTAHFLGFEVATDQPKEFGGNAESPAPLDLFFVSLASCAGFFVQSFCQARDIPIDGISVVQRSEPDEKSHLARKVTIEVRLPSSFPEKYRASVIAAANQCTVKKHLQTPPQIDVTTVVVP